MKKLLGILSVLAVFSTSVFAFTWSGLVDNNTKLSTTDFSKFSLNQSNGIFLSLYTPLSVKGNVSLSAEGLYKYNLVLDNGKNDLTNIADVDLLKLAGTWAMGKGLINLSAGRFYIADSSNAVFSQTSDGLYLSYNSTSFKTAVYAGYTGLLNSLNVSMNVANENKNTQFYNLSAGYIPLSLECSYTGLLGSETFNVQVMGFIDPLQKLPSEYYGTIALSTPVSTLGNIVVLATVGSNEFKNVMMYAKADFSFFANQSVMVNAGAEYASGKQGPFEPFSSITAKTACNLGGGIPLSGVILPDLSITYVKNNLYMNIAEKFVCLMPSEKINFEGFDTTVSLVYNVFSDVQISCNMNAFIDVSDKSKNYYSALVKASFAF